MQYKDLPRGLPDTHVESGKAPRALWFDPKKLSGDYWQYNPRKVFLGFSESGQPVGVADNRHLITVAGSRAGKGISAIIPNLLLYEGSVLVLDPKGENATLTAERRGKGRGIRAGGLNHEVYVIDPFRIASVPDEYRSGFNLLAGLNVDAPEFIDNCDAFADALVIAEPGKENDFWNSAARIVIRGFIAWVAADWQIPEEHRNLGMVRRLLIQPSDGLQTLLGKMVEYGDVGGGIPREAAAFLLGLEDRERASVMATVLAQISFLASKPVRDMLGGGTRSPALRKWKFGSSSIYLCLPAMRLHRHARFFRLFITALLLAVEDDRREPDVPALMILDEMHVLNRMQALETAAGLVAGYGIRIWSIWQDFSQLKAIYDKRWETFLGNTSILQSFGLNDLETLDYISRRMGVSPTMQVSRSEVSLPQAANGFTGETKSLQPSPLLSPDEIACFFSRQSENQLVFHSGVSPIFLNRVLYHKHPFFTDFLQAAA